MDAGTLARAMGCPQRTAEAYVGDMNTAMVAAGCTTVGRAAMWCAQIGHESAGLHYMEEIASGQAYEGRRDLGNVRPGDGRRFKGRGPIQLTGRHNYGLFSLWCHARGLVDRPDFFQLNPAVVATPRWGFLAAAWYWTIARPKLNAQADAGDIVAATRSINGGTNGLADRRERWEACLRLGPALLPTADAAAPGGDWFDMATEDDLRRIIREESPGAVWHHPIPDWYTPADDAMPAFAALGWATTHAAHARDAARQATGVATRAEAGGLTLLKELRQVAAQMTDLAGRAADLPVGGEPAPAGELAGILARLHDLESRLRALESPLEGL